MTYGIFYNLFHIYLSKLPQQTLAFFFTVPWISLVLENLQASSSSSPSVLCVSHHLPPQESENILSSRGRSGQWGSNGGPSVQRSACLVNVAFMSVFASVILFLPAKKKKKKIGKGEVFPNCGKNSFQMSLFQGLKSSLNVLTRFFHLKHLRFFFCIILV